MELECNSQRYTPTRYLLDFVDVSRDPPWFDAFLDQGQPNRVA